MAHQNPTIYTHPHVRVGIGVLILDGNKLLLGKRKNAHGQGCWAPPGGHLEFGESWAQCAQREVTEETGLTIPDFTMCGVTNDIYPTEQKHYITIFMVGKYQNGVVKNCEPEKCEGWQWFALTDLPQPLFVSFHNFTQQPAFQELIAGAGKSDAIKNCVIE